MTHRIYYDGDCGLCHRAVAFVLRRGARGEAFRFAPLGGETFAREVSMDRRAELPDSVVVVAASGRLLVKSEAARFVLRELGGGWRLLGGCFGILPRALRDRIYDAVARRRRRWFPKPEGVCPWGNSEERARFDP